MARGRWICVALAMSSMAGCDRGAGSPPAAEPVNASELHQVLLQIASEYRSWGRVDDEARWGPLGCRNPDPGRAYASSSKDANTHGQKLYSLFARDRNAYVHLSNHKNTDAGQTIVKESWVPEEFTGPGRKPDLHRDQHLVIRTPNPASTERDARSGRLDDRFFPYAEKHGKLFRASKQADLFVMTKLDPKTPDTDAGWVYATITPDGKNVTSAGRVESCMECHRNRPDRLFGLVKTDGPSID
jgi:hypothetical protein